MLSKLSTKQKVGWGLGIAIVALLIIGYFMGWFSSTEPVINKVTLPLNAQEGSTIVQDGITYTYTRGQWKANISGSGRIGRGVDSNGLVNTGITYISPKVTSAEREILKGFEMELRTLQSNPSLSNSSKITQANAIMTNTNKRLSNLGLEPITVANNSTEKQKCGDSLCWELCIILCFHRCSWKCALKKSVID